MPCLSQCCRTRTTQPVLGIKHTKIGISVRNGLRANQDAAHTKEDSIHRKEGTRARSRLAYFLCRSFKGDHINKLAPDVPSDAAIDKRIRQLERSRSSQGIR